MKKRIHFQIIFFIVLSGLSIISCAPSTKHPPSFISLSLPAPTSIAPSPQSAVECGGRGVVDEPGADFGYQGAIAYYDTVSEKIMLVGGENLQTREPPITNSPVYLIGFSPDGKWLAYRTLPAVFHLLSSTNEQITLATDVKPLLSYIPEDTAIDQISWPNWVNNQVLSLGMNNPREGQPKYHFMAYLDIVSSEWVLLNTYELKGKDVYQRGIPSPDLSRLLYVHDLADGKYSLILVDTTSLNELMSYENLRNISIIEGVPNDEVVWSYGSEKVAFIDYTYDRQPIISIWSRDGSVIQEFFLFPEATVNSIRWSADGKYLAIGITEIAEDAPNWSTSSILIYSQNLNQIIFTCPIAGHKYLEDFVWGPDQSAIIYFADYGDDEVGKIIYLDLVEGTSTLIASNVSDFGGWSPEFGN